MHAPCSAMLCVTECTPHHHKAGSFHVVHSLPTLLTSRKSCLSSIGSTMLSA